MKTFLFVTILTISLLIISCGDNVSVPSKSNEYLGELPSIVKNNIASEEAKEKELKKATDMNEAFKLDKELKLLKEENKEKILKYISSAKMFGKEIPFEAISDNNILTLNKVLLDTAYSNGRVVFKFISTINNDVNPQRHTPIVYFKALDKQGVEISGANSVAAGSRLDINPGDIVNTTGILDANLLEDFAKIVQITKEEYDKK